MSDSTLDELEGLSRRAVELSRNTPVPEAELAAAVARISTRTPPAPRPAWRLPLREAIAAAGVVLAIAGLVNRAPAAWDEVTVAARMTVQSGADAAPASMVKAPHERTLRGLLLIHVFSVLAGYAAYALAWMLSCILLIAMFFTEAPRLRTITMRIGAILPPLGVLLMGVSIVLGAVWAKPNLGRYWDWDVREINGLAALLIGVVWSIFAWRRMLSGTYGAHGRVAPGAVAAACFWASIGGWWAMACATSGIYIWQAGLCILLCMLVNVALLAAAWQSARAPQTVLE